MPVRVLAAVYGGEQMEQVVDRALEIARQEDGELIIGHVVDPSFLNAIRGGRHVPDSTVEGMENIGRRHVEGQIERVQGQGVPLKALIRRGALFEELGEMIEEYEVSTLVVGGHKHHFLETHDEYDWTELVEKTGVQVEVVKTDA